MDKRSRVKKYHARADLYRLYAKGHTMWLYDTHVHLSDSQYMDDMDSIMRMMKLASIRACCVSTDAADSERTLKIAKSSDLILPFVGIHPEKAAEGPDKVSHIIEQNSDVISGIGEIGLDPTLCGSKDDAKAQRRAFEAMLYMAEKYDKPVSLHTRRSLDEVLDILGSFSVRGALHWFDGNKKQLRRAEEAGLFISYGPVSIYAADKQVLLGRTDPARILAETDGPVRFKCFGMRRTQAVFVTGVACCIARVLDISYTETLGLLEDNARRFLGV